MRKRTQILFILVISFFFSSLKVKAQAPPLVYNKESFVYTMIKKIAGDLDKEVSSLGIKVHSCSVVLTNGKILSFPSLINCLLVSLDFQLRMSTDSEIKAWILNAKGEYLPPLIISWRPSHKSWFGVIGEGIYLYFGEGLYHELENFFKRFNSQSMSRKDCEFEKSFLKKDLGNFVGLLSIKAPAPWTLIDYFQGAQALKYPIVDNVEQAKLIVKSPFMDKGKIVYDLQLQLFSQNRKQVGDDLLELKIRTNYNLLSTYDERTTCGKGELKLSNPSESLNTSVSQGSKP